MKTVVREATRYAAVSACAFIIDITVLFILVHYLSRWYVAAATSSFLVGLLVAYVWNFVARRQFLFARRRAA
jgi:putative flippase GtrA